MGLPDTIQVSSLRKGKSEPRMKEEARMMTRSATLETLILYPIVELHGLRTILASTACSTAAKSINYTRDRSPALPPQVGAQVFAPCFGHVFLISSWVPGSTVVLGLRSDLASRHKRRLAPDLSRWVIVRNIPIHSPLRMIAAVQYIIHTSIHSQKQKHRQNPRPICLRRHIYRTTRL